MCALPFEVTGRSLRTGTPRQQSNPHEHFEAEVPRERLRELALEQGHTVTASFLHIRLFENNRFIEDPNHFAIQT
jgi:hypothetical protein